MNKALCVRISITQSVKYFITVEKFPTIKIGNSIIYLIKCNSYLGVNLIKSYNLN
jgi:hypothetical protein